MWLLPLVAADTVASMDGGCIQRRGRAKPCGRQCASTMKKLGTCACAAQELALRGAVVSISTSCCAVCLATMLTADGRKLGRADPATPHCPYLRRCQIQVTIQADFKL